MTPFETHVIDALADIAWMLLCVIAPLLGAILWAVIDCRRERTRTIKPRNSIKNEDEENGQEGKCFK